MKISLNWLAKHITLTETPEQIAELLTNCGLEVEDLYETGQVKGGFAGLVVGHVLDVSQHPNADRLRITKVDIGNDVPLNIVCGAPNVAAGQKVIVAPIGTTIYPLSGEPMTMKKAKIRGEESEGMICAEDEIGLGTSHDGILILDANCKAGTPISEVIKTDSDFIFEIGLTPNRGDAASHLGIARDLKAILNRPLTDDDNYSFSSDTKGSSISVSIKDGNTCGRYSGLLIKDISIAPSPDWLQKSLKAIGINPINNVVDITNYIMHDIGQPMHAFDADKLKENINVRLSNSGETLTLLDKTERKLTGEELVIADKNGPLALAGVMGGLSSSITESTKTIFLESAWFNAANVRKTAKLHTISTDSSFRFERGVDPHNTANALKKATKLILEIAGGTIASELIDVQPESIVLPKVNFLYKKFKTLAGVNIDNVTLKTILKNLDIEILNETSDGLELSIPNYRTDVTRDIDVFEDILRIYGYNNIPFPEIMHSAAVVQPKPDKNFIKQTISNYLSAQGFNEIMTNSLTRESYFETDELEKAVKLLNPLSNELAILRTGILPSMLEAIAYNKNRKAHDLKFYEFGKVYQHSETGFKEFEKLAIVVTGNKEAPNWRQKPAKADYYFIKSVVENTLAAVGAKKTKGVTIEEVGSDLLKKLDIKGSVWYAEVNVDALISATTKNKFKLQEIPVFPEVSRDLSLVLNKAVPYSDIETIVNQTIGKYLRKLTVFDVFEGKPLEEGQKSYTFNMVLYDNEKTMNDKQIDAIMQKLIATFENQLKAVVRK
jgi:phenylalanyl-tRNA synthetase beta chain